jgi:phosphoribosylglycinamide formyltransferase-1
MNTFQVIVETGLQSAFVCERLLQAVNCAGFRGLLVAGSAPTEEITQAELAFHEGFGGHRYGPHVDAALPPSYRPLSPTTAEMLVLEGVPSVSVSSFPGAEFLGAPLSGVPERTLRGIRSHGSRHLVFAFVDQIFDSRWLQQVRLVNAHPGILPFARGVGALEQIAATGDCELFMRAAGATLHYVTEHVDAGPIIATRALHDPLSFRSMVELRAANFLLLFDLIAATAADHCHEIGPLPRGLVRADAKAYPLYKRNMRTAELQLAAEAAFQSFRSARGIRS